MSAPHVEVLRPLVVTRVANTIPGVVWLFVGGVALSAAREVPALGLPVIALALAATLTTSARGYRLRAELASDHMVVFGWLSNRAIPRGSIESISFGMIHWHDPLARWLGQRAALPDIGVLDR